ncbi:hypothetical protein [Fusobacterium varium]|uniref:hypothetical protein n=1 Tax=Fusobacterium varium TaxID=856 RepID=UPI0035677224
MKAWNKKRKPKHTTRIKQGEIFGIYFGYSKKTKSYSITDSIFGSTKFKAYLLTKYVN